MFLELLFLGPHCTIIELRETEYKVDEKLVIDKLTEFHAMSRNKAEILEGSDGKIYQEPSTSSYSQSHARMFP